jgi:hypothetical protein
LVGNKCQFRLANLRISNEKCLVSFEFVNQTNLFTAYLLY